MSYTIYGKANCAGCEQAKNLLDAKGQAYKYTDIMADPAAMQMFRSKGFRSVPQIFRGDEHIGSESDLKAIIG